MATENPTPIRPPQDTTIDDIVEAQQILMGIEAMARVLSTEATLQTAGDAGSDLVAYCMAMAREAERGWMLTGELIESLRGGAS